MDPNSEVTQYREEQALDECIYADDCTTRGVDIGGWLFLAALAYVMFVGGRTTRLVILGMLAIPVVGLGLVLGVPYLLHYAFGDALSGGQRALVTLLVIAGILWLGCRDRTPK